jgi:hypothetical protein
MAAAAKVTWAELRTRAVPGLVPRVRAIAGKAGPKAVAVAAKQEATIMLCAIILRVVGLKWGFERMVVGKLLHVHEYDGV